MAPLRITITNVKQTRDVLQIHVQCANVGQKSLYVAYRQAERVLPFIDWRGNVLTLYYGPRKVDKDKYYVRPATTIFRLIDANGMLEWDEQVMVPVWACKCSLFPLGTSFRVGRFEVEVAYFTEWPYPERPPGPGEAGYVQDADLGHKPASSRSALLRCPDALDVTAVQTCDADW